MGDVGGGRLRGWQVCGPVLGQEERVSQEPAGRRRLPAGPVSLAFGIDDLPRLRRVTAQWAAQAGLPDDRTADFVLAVHEIAANAVLYGSAAARLLLWADEGMVVAEVGDRGRWQPDRPDGRSGMGLPLAHQVCDEVQIRAGPEGTTVLLRMRLDGTGWSPGIRHK